MINLIGTQTIHTERLLLRKFREGDAAVMYRNYTSDPNVTRYTSWPTHPSQDVTEQFLAYQLGRYADDSGFVWAIEFDGEIVGSIDVISMSKKNEHCEIGYCLGSKWWNKGIMTEALRAVEGYLFDKAGFHCVCACHHENNPASGRVMEKAGMQYEGTLRARKKNADGTFGSIKYYSILKEEFQH